MNEATGGSDVQMKFGIVLVPTQPLPSVTESPMSKHPFVVNELVNELQLFPAGAPLIHQVHPFEFPEVVLRIVVENGMHPESELQVKVGTGKAFT